MAVHAPSPLATNVVTMPFSNSRLLQLADLIVSISTAMVAGHTEFAGKVFQTSRQSSERTRAESGE